MDSLFRFQLLVIRFKQFIYVLSFLSNDILYRVYMLFSGWEVRIVKKNYWPDPKAVNNFFFFLL